MSEDLPPQPGMVKIRPGDPRAHWEDRVGCGGIEVRHGPDGSLWVMPEHARALIRSGGYVIVE
jgi:hypothetical protein